MVKSELYLHDATLSIDEAIEGLYTIYVVSDKPRTKRFLERHPYLLSFLEEAPAYIERHFPGAPLSLEVANDPEAGPKDTQVVAYIGTTLSPEAALANLKRFDQEWWLDKVAHTQGSMVINVEFI